MVYTQTPLLRLSQGQLNILERCPRQFQHTYIEQLASLANPEQQEKQTLGSRFHLLMQQREMGLPIDALLEEDEEMQRWMAAFAQAAPEILSPDSHRQTFRESEHYRTLQVQNYLLTVVYDLLIADDWQAQIIDWKTYPKPPTKRKLQTNWQTRLYLYVLAETSEYLPENISMTYWFVQTKGQPQNIKFNYTLAQHQQTEKKLNQLLRKLTNYLADYEKDKPFPQISESSKHCDYCQYATRCQRQAVTATDFTLLPDLVSIDTIQEVSL
jgi:predicted RecB family nuclease